MNINEEKHLNYYRTKFKDNFSPALLEFHLREALEKAKKSYDPSKGSFSTHLATYMQKLNRVANYKGGLIKDTEYNKNLTNKVMNTFYELKTLHEITPTPEDIAKKTKMPLKKVKEILKNNTFAAIVPGVDTAKIHIDADILNGLDGDEKKVLETIQKDINPPEKAYEYTNLSKTKYYEVRNRVRDKLRKAYLNTLKENHVTDSA